MGGKHFFRFPPRGPNHGGEKIFSPPGVRIMGGKNLQKNRRLRRAIRKMCFYIVSMFIFRYKITIFSPAAQTDPSLQFCKARDVPLALQKAIFLKGARAQCVLLNDFPNTRACLYHCIKRNIERAGALLNDFPNTRACLYHCRKRNIECTGAFLNHFVPTG